MEDIRDVTSAAEEPRPVLLVLWIGVGIGWKGVSLDREDILGGRSDLDN